MMKKNSSIKQLEEEKQKLFRRQLELEKVIKYDWRDVKESFNPLHIANSIISGFNKKKDSENKHSFIAENISEMFSNYTRKLTGKFEQKLTDWLKSDHS